MTKLLRWVSTAEENNYYVIVTPVVYAKHLAVIKFGDLGANAGWLT